jgi:DNA modification methylase
VASTSKPLSERLSESAARRQALIDRVGFVPLSILQMGRGQLHKAVYHYAKERAVAGLNNSLREFESKGESGRGTHTERQALGVLGGRLAPQANRESVSIMSAELVDFLIRYYLDDGVYIDPFAGQGVQAQVAALRGVDYYGCDLTEAYVEFTNAVLDKFPLADGQHIEVRRGDSRETPEWIPDGVGDFLFTSPPYWDIEFYSDDPEQLGTAADGYDDFVDMLADVFVAWRPKLRDGATVVLNVNDFRRSGTFYPYHTDLTVALQHTLLYRLTDTWIVSGVLGQLPRAFAVQHNTRRVAPKIHEYLLVFEAV